MWPHSTSIEVERDLSRVNKPLYIGPWAHIEPATNNSLSNVKEFIFVDTQPRSENDNNPFTEASYKHDFIDELLQKCESLGFILKKKTIIDKNYHKRILPENEQKDCLSKYPDINPCLYYFKHKYTKQKLKYYVSTNVERNMHLELQNHMLESDALIVSGYFPDTNLFNYFPKSKMFIGYTDTVYPDGSYLDTYFVESDNIISYIVNTDEEQEKRYFNSYYLCSIFTNHILKCDNIIQLGKYNTIESTINLCDT